MDFQSLAASETSTLLERLLADHTGGAAQQLQAVREALDLAAMALAEPLRAQADVQELAARLTRAADAEIQRVRQDADHALETARQDIQALTVDIDRLRAHIAQADAEAALLKSEVQTASERAESAERDLGLTIDAHAAVEAALHQAKHDARQVLQAKAALETELGDARAAIELMVEEADGLRARCERLASEKTAFENELAAARTRGDERDVVAADLAAARTRVQALKTDLAAAQELRDQRDALTRELAAAAARAADLERDLADARSAADHEREAVGNDLRAAVAKVQALESELTAAVEARDQRDAAVRELELSQERLGSLDAARGAAEERLRDLQGRLDQAQGEIARLEARALATRESPASGDADRLRDEVERMVSLFDASARAVSEMAAAASSTELLTELVKRLSLQFSRVALFRLKGNRLEGEQQIGFEDIGDFARVVIPTSVDSLLTRALSSGAVQSISGADVPVRSGTPFGGTPTSAVALPIALQGTTLAVVYADDSDMPDSARGPAVHESSVGFARLLVGQVVVLLVRHTHELKTLAELTQYATTLLQEAKEMYLADAQSGKNADLLRSRLKANIDCASQLFTYRAAMEGTAAASLLDDQIARELADSTPFARDLAAVLNDMSGSDVQLTAEAS